MEITVMHFSEMKHKHKDIPSHSFSSVTPTVNLFQEVLILIYLMCKNVQRT